MENRIRLVGLVATAVFATALGSCAGNGNDNITGSGGSSASGGNGAGGTGGSNATGGSGGSSSSGGSNGTGGNTSSGGTTGRGGTGGTASGGAGGTGTGGAKGGSGGTGTGGTGTGGAAGAGTGGAKGGTGGTATGGAAGSAAGAPGTGGATTPGTCSDNMQNQNETGVDCGGSCPACPNYKINPPNLKNNAPSACTSGQQSGTAGFMCTRSMVFSPEMKAAAADDFTGTSANPQFVYGVVGHDKDSGGVDGQSGSTCCQCYQLVFVSNSDNVSGVATPKPMIVQAFNTGAGTKNFDIFMGDGGEGAFTNGCTNGLYSNYPSLGQPSNGGIRALTVSQCSSSGKVSAASVAAASCQSAIMSECDMITSNSSSVQSTTQNSCIEVSQPQNLYHLNWSVMVKRVECPANLTRVTGCKLNPQGLPAPDPTAVDMTSASGKGFSSGYTTTTMQDCCRPSCAWPTNVNGADSQYGSFYTCDVSGNPS